MIYIVTGMHRSGTSMVASLLHRGGVNMGSEFRKTLPENPKGFYEEEAFRRINDRLLKEVGYTVKNWNPQFDGILAPSGSHSAAVSLVERFSDRSDMWGWKDPRTCLTISFWLDVINTLELLQKTRVIVIERQVNSVSKSLCKRGNLSSHSQGAKLWRMYNDHLTRCLSEFPTQLRVLRLRYERVVQGLDIGVLASFCGLELDKNLVDASLDHSDEDCDCISTRINMGFHDSAMDPSLG